MNGGQDTLLWIAIGSLAVALSIGLGLIEKIYYKRNHARR
jgi:hypothetical protein